MSRRAHFDVSNGAVAEYRQPGQQARHVDRNNPRPQTNLVQSRASVSQEEDDRDQTLYHIPGYRYPHTLTFLNNVTPEAELETMARMMKDVQGPTNESIDQTLTAASARLISEAGLPGPENQSWSAYIKHL